MPINIVKQLEYLMVFVKMFADRLGISEKQAFNYFGRTQRFFFCEGTL